MDNRKKSILNQCKALDLLGSFGYMTTAQLGAWLWPASNRNTQYNSAKALLLKLRHKGWVSKRTMMLTGTTAWVLSKAGADEANLAAMVEDRPEGYAHGMNLEFKYALQDDLVQQLLRDLCHRDPDLKPIGIHGLRHGLHGFDLPSKDAKGAAGDLFDAMLYSPFEGTHYGVLLLADAAPHTIKRAKARGEQLQLLVLCRDHNVRVLARELPARTAFFPVAGKDWAFTGKADRRFEQWVAPPPDQK